MPPGVLATDGLGALQPGSYPEGTRRAAGSGSLTRSKTYFQRSDNFSLALKGVVAHTAAGWGTVPTYHQPNDDLAHLDLPFMTAAIQSLVEPMRWLASKRLQTHVEPGRTAHRKTIMALTAAVAFAKDNGERFVEELKALLRIPSISTDPERAGDVRQSRAVRGRGADAHRA